MKVFRIFSIFLLLGLSVYILITNYMDHEESSDLPTDYPSNPDNHTNPPITKEEDPNKNPIIEALEKESYYISDLSDRYLSYYEKNKQKSKEEIVAEVNSNIDFAYYTKVNQTDLSKNDLILVNKYYYLPESFEPSDLVTISSQYGYQGKIKKDVYDAYIKMVESAKKIGLSIPIVSPYRSYASQKTIYQNYVNRDGQVMADTYSARAGYSEHQTGLAIDIGVIANSFEHTKEYTWLKENAHKYGFVIRYPKGKEHLTGYQFEPWHYRYVGVTIAKKIVELDITFDEYYAYFVR